MTRKLLLCGAVAGPFYLVVGILQSLFREGFSFERHPLSVLANGSLGWIQTANFLISGGLVIAAAAGIARTLGRGSRGLTWTIYGYGGAMIAAAIFTADPVDGFPPGTPLGFPTSISTTGLLHFVCGALAFLFPLYRGFVSFIPLSRNESVLLGGALLLFGAVALFIEYRREMAKE